jgi:hypothetical protein
VNQPGRSLQYLVAGGLGQPCVEAEVSRRGHVQILRRLVLVNQSFQRLKLFGADVDRSEPCRLPFQASAGDQHSDDVLDIARLKRPHQLRTGSG